VIDTKTGHSVPTVIGAVITEPPTKKGLTVEVMRATFTSHLPSAA
jgi:hypothetical protein